MGITDRNSTPTHLPTTYPSIELLAESIDPKRLSIQSTTHNRFLIWSVCVLPWAAVAAWSALVRRFVGPVGCRLSVEAYNGSLAVASVFGFTLFCHMWFHIPYVLLLVGRRLPSALACTSDPGLRPTDFSIPLHCCVGRSKRSPPQPNGLTRIAHHHRRLLNMARPAPPFTYERRRMGRVLTHCGGCQAFVRCHSPLRPFTHHIIKSCGTGAVWPLSISAAHP